MPLTAPLCFAGWRGDALLLKTPCIFTKAVTGKISVEYPPHDFSLAFVNDQFSVCGKTISIADAVGNFRIHGAEGLPHAGCYPDSLLYSIRYPSFQVFFRK